MSAYRDETSDVTILFHAVIRKLRPPTDEELRATTDCIEVRHRNYSLKKKGVKPGGVKPGKVSLLKKNEKIRKNKAKQGKKEKK